MDIKGIEKDIQEIQTVHGKRFQLKMKVPEEFYVKIIGDENSSTRKLLQSETMTHILVSREEPAESIIIIEGGSKDSVFAAKFKIDRLVAPKPSFLSAEFYEPSFRRSPF